MRPDLTDTHHCVAVAPPIAPSQRISLSLNILANSEHIAVVVTGESKRRLLDKITEKPDPGLPIDWLLQGTQTTITAFETN
jgi:6-phosphogluconolactonase